MTERTAARTADLLDSFGVVTHLPYTDGGYRELSATTNALNYLGLDHVRDQAPNPEYDEYGQEHFADAAAAGIHFTFVVEGGVDPSVTVQRIHAIEQAYPGTVTAIEGPNEVNNWPVTYNGQTGTAAAQAYMRDLFNAVQADPLLRDITVSGFTDWPNHASTSDTSTIHPYAKDGDQPLDRILQDMEDQNAVDPGKQFLITETGYHTQINPSEGWEGVSEAVQAKLILNTYMDGALAGAQQTYVYQLLDAYAGDSQEEHFGLFRLDNSPKPAATAIHNLTTILADTGSTAESFATGSLDLTVTGAPATGHTYLTEKSNGSYQVITWAEPDIWDEAGNRAITVAPTTETISFGKTFGTVEIFDPLLGTTPIQTLHDVSSVSLSVTDHPLVVQLSGAGTTPTPTPTPTPMPTPTPTPTPTPSVPASQPVSLEAGSGADTLVLRISEDAWNGDAQYTVKVDGQQIGGTFTAHALHSTGQSDTLTLHGTWGTGAHEVTVEFLNDAYDGTAATDRNLYIDGLTYNGVSHPELAQAINSSGEQDLAIAATAPAPAPASGAITGTSARETLTGTAGNDLINGGGGDTLKGGRGDDTYTVTAGDKVVELSGQGTDTVKTGINNYALPANVEDLVVTGTGANTVFGNGLANTITGNGLANTLNGRGGNDVLTGGAGNDTFVIRKGMGHDTITDFQGAGIAGGDKLQFSGFGRGATLSHVGDDWAIKAADGSVTHVTIDHVTSLTASDYAFG